MAALSRERIRLTYCLNQEKYLRVFLTNPEVPMDNNAAERAIRPFCVEKKNWKLIDTIHGAEASAIIYSIVETCKLNNLNIFYYISHLLTEIPKHMYDTDLDFLFCFFCKGTGGLPVTESQILSSFLVSVTKLLTITNRANLITRLTLFCFIFCIDYEIIFLSSCYFCLPAL